jgi:hypothetical protein
MAFAGPNWKPSGTARRKATFEDRLKRDREEENEKQKVRRRDVTCRFPLCGCKRIRLRLEVSHDFHKGMGSKRGVSLAPLMVLLCTHRHQHGRISRHAGTLRSVYLTPDHYEDVVAWQLAVDALPQDLRARVPDDIIEADGWVTVAREHTIKPRTLEPLDPWQLDVLTALSEMDV